MTASDRAPASLGTKRGCLYWPLFCGLTVLLWLGTVRLPSFHPFSEDPETSWHVLLHYAFANRWQWGTDFLFTFGPLGFLLNDFYDPATLRYSLAFSLGFHCLVLALASQVILEVRSHLAKAVMLLLLLNIGVFSKHFSRDALYTALLWLIVSGYIASGSRSLPRALLIAVVTVTLSLVKFTFLVWCTIALGVLALQLWRGRNLLAALAFVGSTSSLAAGFWVACGQSLANVPAYLNGSRQISQGYVIAMSLPGPVEDVRFALGIGVCLSLLLLLSLLSRPDKWPALLVSGLSGMTLCLVWKHSFVRPDAHTSIFFTVAPCLATAIFLGTADPGRGYLGRLLRSLLFIATVALSLHAGGESNRYSDPAFRVRNYPEYLRRQFQNNWQRLARMRSFFDEQELQWQQAQEQQRLENVIARVGNEPVAWYMNSQSRPILGGLNLAPRGVAQSYSAYTVPLNRLDEQLFLGPQPPRFVALNLDPIDGRWPLGDDSLALLQILSHYRLLENYGTFLLFERSSPPKPIEPTGPALVDRPVQFGEWIDVPRRTGPWKIFSVDLSLSRRGQLLTALYKTPPVEVHLETWEGQSHVFRIIPGQSECWSLLDPLILDNQSLENFLAGNAAREARRLRITIADDARGGFQEPFRIQVSEYSARALSK